MCVWSNLPNTVNHNPESLWRQKEQGMFSSVLFPLGRLSHYIDFSFHSRYYGPNASCVFTEILLWGMESIFNNHKWLLELILFSASESVNVSNALGAKCSFTVQPTRCHFGRISRIEVKKFHKCAVKMCYVEVWGCSLLCINTYSNVCFPILINKVETNLCQEKSEKFMTIWLRNF